MNDNKSSLEALMPRAKTLVTKTDATIERATKIFSDGNLPEESWLRLSTVARQEEQARKKSEAIQRSTEALESMKTELETAIGQFKNDLKKALHPLLTSMSTYDEERGRYQEDHAYRILNLGGVAILEAEYKYAWEAGNVEACTALIEWAERMMKEPHERQVIEDVKVLHIQHLELNPLLLSIEALSKKRDEAVSRLAMLAEGLPPSLSLAQDTNEARKILIAGGLAVNA